MPARIRRGRPRLGLIIAILASYLVFTVLVGSSDSLPRVDVTLDELETLIAEDRVASAEIRVDSDTIRGTLRPAAGESEEVEFETRYPDGFEGEITGLLLESSASTTVKPTGQSVLTIILGLLPVLLLVGLGVFFFRRIASAQGGLANIRRAQTKRLTADQPRVTFADVAGLDEAIVELGEIKEFLESPGRFHSMGAHVPKGVLLTGSPGTGKTLLARAVAGEAGVPFFSISGSDFVEMFVGVGASRVRDLFKQAKTEAPAIVFIDEIDAVGRNRADRVRWGE